MLFYADTSICFGGSVDDLGESGTDSQGPPHRRKPDSKAINVSAEDEELLTAFKRLGFERASVGYNLRKIFGRESLRFEPTIGPSAVSCWKCGGRRFRFLKKEESDEEECAVYACLRCGEEKIITSAISGE